jgi:hypothetical protein
MAMAGVFLAKRRSLSFPEGSRNLSAMLISNGARRAVVESRKFAATLGTDVAGYSRFAGSDEHGETPECPCVFVLEKVYA